jgi:hypothetical protein
MSDWIRFHRELCEGAKRGLPRAARFIFLELSRLSRPKRGVIHLTPGMTDVDAVHDAIGGSRKEIAESLKCLTSPLPGETEPMLRVDDRNGARLLVVLQWEKWNPVDVTSTERQRRKRDKDRDGNGGSNGPVTPPVTVPVTRDIGRDNRDPNRDVTEPRGEESRVEENRVDPPNPRDTSLTAPPAEIPITDAIRGSCVMAGAREPTPQDAMACLANARKKGYVRADWAQELVSWMIRGKRWDQPNQPPPTSSPSRKRIESLRPKESSE